ncbi:hypothetical protein [Microbacterium sp. NPDC055521]
MHEFLPVAVGTLSGGLVAPVVLGIGLRVATAPPPDTRSTEQQIADLEREIEEWRLRQEIEKRKKDRGDSVSED